MNSDLNKNPNAGNLLISEPFLQDENFVRSVVLLCENNEEGSFGLILNKPSILHLGELVEELSFLDNEVYVGGPVEQNTLHFIYFDENQLNGSVSIGKNMWYGGEYEELVEKLKLGIIPSEKVFFFIGYSGWGPKQLEEELNENTWIVCREDIDDLTLQNTEEDLWKVLLKNMGGEFKVLANYPLDPRLN
ncbi:putative transcriptional regulator [Algoriphagus boseongensis]|uniref:Putative transcriptional regulator n=1 Tax=Algoriphagus boseongensis TaxID=1442587 RepID=A0A4R6TBG4_9BACT|nr:YqgE/AlgH family protein [Algoriphagus boseongensis]TDQ19005.1 putative transcriptional regulator [Algoriphagus boseongensis]